MIEVPADSLTFFFERLILSFEGSDLGIVCSY